MLYETTKDPIHLVYAEHIFNEILSGENYMITGGVPEFFGFNASTESSRDEGCSEADFFLLSLQLWRSTGNIRYLDQAEYTFMNHMLFNQFKSGDFGSHVIKRGFGFVTASAPGQCWWCCDYHGLQALHEARKTVVTRDDNLIKINLFYPVDWEDDEISFSLKKVEAAVPAFQILVKKVSGNNLFLAIRNPGWSSSVSINLNGKEARITEQNGYLKIDNQLKRGDEIIFSLKPVLRLVDQNLNEINISGLSARPVKAAMIYGPWLMSVDDVRQTLFLAELSENNIIYIPSDISNINAEPDQIPAETFNPESYLSFTFLKEGTSQTGTVTLRPISEVTFQGPSNVRYWFNFAKTSCNLK